MSDQVGDLPERLQEIVDDFAMLDPGDRLQLLLELGQELPELPERYVAHPDRLEPVPECQSPIFLAVEVDQSASGAPVHLFFSAPAEAPTTRGFAGILQQGLDGLPAADVVAIPNDLPLRMSLTEQVSPLRLRGMAGMLARIKQQVVARIPA